MGATNKIKIPLEQFEEIIAGAKNDALVSWLSQKDVKQSLLLKEEADPAAVAQIISAGYAPDLTEVEVLKVGKDPFLIAYALTDIDNRTVVSFETSAPSKQRANRKVPDVCSTFRIRCIKMFDLIEELDFKVS
jgi:hypothetical protein